MGAFLLDSASRRNSSVKVNVAWDENDYQVSSQPSPPRTESLIEGTEEKGGATTFFANQLKIQAHFSRAYACFVQYFLMSQKLQQIRKLAYVPSLGPDGTRVSSSSPLIRSVSI